MKCALVIPSWKPEDIFPQKTTSSQINYWQPLGTLYVASSMLEAGHEVKLLIGAFMVHGEIMREIAGYSPDFVGIYSTAFGWKRAMETASDIKRGLKNVFITAGGPYPIATRELCLVDSVWIDAVVTGEGEITVVEMLERLSQGRALSGVRGIIFREAKEVGLKVFTPFPGTELYDNIGKYGTMSDDLTDFTYQGAAFIPFSMTREEITRLRL